MVISPIDSRLRGNEGNLLFWIPSHQSYAKALGTRAEEGRLEIKSREILKK